MWEVGTLSSPGTDGWSTLTRVRDSRASCSQRAAGTLTSLDQVSKGCAPKEAGKREKQRCSPTALTQLGSCMSRCWHVGKADGLQWSSVYGVRSATPAVTPRLWNWSRHEDVLAGKRPILSPNSQAGPSHLQVGDRFSVCPGTLSPSSAFSPPPWSAACTSWDQPLVLANWLL